MEVLIHPIRIYCGQADGGKGFDPASEQVVPSRRAKSIVPKGGPYQELKLLQVMNAVNHEPRTPERNHPERFFPAPEGPVV